MSWHLLQTWWCQYTYIFSTTIHGIRCHTFRGSTEKETNTNDRTIPMQHFNLIQLIYRIPYSYKLQCAGHLLKWAMNIFFGTHARATTTTITRETERERERYLYKPFDWLWINFHLIKTLQTCPNAVHIGTLTVWHSQLSERNEWIYGVNVRFISATTLFNLWSCNVQSRKPRERKKTWRNKNIHFKMIKIKSTSHIKPDINAW